MRTEEQLDKKPLKALSSTEEPVAPTLKQISAQMIDILKNIILLPNGLVFLINDYLKEPLSLSWETEEFKHLFDPDSKWNELYINALVLRAIKNYQLTAQGSSNFADDQYLSYLVNRIGCTHYFIAEAPHNESMSNTLIELVFNTGMQGIIRLGHPGIDYSDCLPKSDDEERLVGGCRVKKLPRSSDGFPGGIFTIKQEHKQNKLFTFDLPIQDGSCLSIYTFDGFSSRHNEKNRELLNQLYSMYFLSAKESVVTQFSAEVSTASSVILNFLILDYYEDVFLEDSSLAEVRYLQAYIATAADAKLTYDQYTNAIINANYLYEYEKELPREKIKNRSGIPDFKTIKEGIDPLVYEIIVKGIDAKKAIADEKRQEKFAHAAYSIIEALLRRINYISIEEKELKKVAGEKLVTALKKLLGRLTAIATPLKLKESQVQVDKDEIDHAEMTQKLYQVVQAARVFFLEFFSKKKIHMTYHSFEKIWKSLYDKSINLNDEETIALVESCAADGWRVLLADQISSRYHFPKLEEQNYNRYSLLAADSKAWERINEFSNYSRSYTELKGFFFLAKTLDEVNMSFGECLENQNRFDINRLKENLTKITKFQDSFAIEQFKCIIDGIYPSLSSAVEVLLTNNTLVKTVCLPKVLVILINEYLKPFKDVAYIDWGDPLLALLESGEEWEKLLKCCIDTIVLQGDGEYQLTVAGYSNLADKGFPDYSLNRIGKTNYAIGEGPPYDLMIKKFLETLRFSDIVGLILVGYPGTDSKPYLPVKDGEEYSFGDCRVERSSSDNFQGKTVPITGQEHKHKEISTLNLNIADGCYVSFFLDHEGAKSQLSKLYSMYLLSAKGVVAAHCAAGVRRVPSVILNFLILDYFEDVFSADSPLAEVYYLYIFIVSFRPCTRLTYDQIEEVTKSAYYLHKYAEKLPLEEIKDRSGIPTFKEIKEAIHPLVYKIMIKRIPVEKAINDEEKKTENFAQAAGSIIKALKWRIDCISIQAKDEENFVISLRNLLNRLTDIVSPLQGSQVGKEQAEKAKKLYKMVQATEEFISSFLTRREGIYLYPDVDEEYKSLYFASMNIQDEKTAELVKSSVRCTPRAYLANFFQPPPTASYASSSSSSSSSSSNSYALQ